MNGAETNRAIAYRKRGDAPPFKPAIGWVNYKRPVCNKLPLKGIKCKCRQAGEI